MARLIAKHGPCELTTRKRSSFQTLASSIISQQLSSKAAHTIKQRLQAVVPSFTPDGILSVPIDVLRQVGLSGAKISYITEIARRINDGRLNFRALRHQPDAKVIATLVELPGIGQWTAEMFLIFGLRRPDVLALGDAGLQRAVRLLFGPSVDLSTAGKPWRPYRSVASWYLWRHLDG